MVRSNDAEGQLAFDIDALIHEAAAEAAPPWQGAPLHFTTGYHSSGDLDAAFAHWQFLHGPFNSYALSHMWHRAIAVPGGVAVAEHGFDLFTAELRCLADDHHRHGACACIGEMLYQVVCEPCELHQITAGENTAVEFWHDHAIPGWRDLPIVPARIPLSDGAGLTKTARAWIIEHYPPSMQFTGAPIITERTGIGTRHVAGRSPWGGYDLSQTALPVERRLVSPPPAKRRPQRTATPRMVTARAVDLSVQSLPPRDADDVRHGIGD